MNSDEYIYPKPLFSLHGSTQHGTDFEHLIKRRGSFLYLLSRDVPLPWFTDRARHLSENTNERNALVASSERIREYSLLANSYSSILWTRKVNTSNNIINYFAVMRKRNM